MARSTWRGLIVLGLSALSWFLASTVVMADDVSRSIAPSTSTTRHSKFHVLDGPFESGREVTRACLTCHTEAANQVRRSVHWTWEYKPADSDEKNGKLHLLNTFCGTVSTNMSLCTSCHVGYGWQEPGNDSVVDEQVDCLVCHEQTRKYKKYNYGSAVLKYKDRVLKKPDFPSMAHSVTRPTRWNCGFCHFYGGSGDGAKHGDLDSSLFEPNHRLDVHMDAAGLNFDCVTCHTANDHAITGSRYDMKAQDPIGVDRPGHTDATRSSCASCHGNAPHGDKKINDHTDRVACQTCHIPRMARGGVGTMVFWDWRTAGKRAGDLEPPEAFEREGHTSKMMQAKYSDSHGTSWWAENLVPKFAWFDGRIRYLNIKQTVDDSELVRINRVLGEPGNPGARIWPFKNTLAMMPYDPVNKIMIANHLIRNAPEDKEAFEASFDWRRSAAVGMKAKGLPFSGEVAFVEAVMSFPLTHMVAPKEEALSCLECHRDGGRLEGLEGVYLPGRKNFPLLYAIGIGAVVVTLIGIFIHAAIRGLMAWGRH